MSLLLRRFSWPNLACMCIFDTIRIYRKYSEWGQYTSQQQWHICNLTTNQTTTAGVFLNNLDKYSFNRCMSVAVEYLNHRWHATTVWVRLYFDFVANEANLATDLRLSQSTLLCHNELTVTSHSVCVISQIENTARSKCNHKLTSYDVTMWGHTVRSLWYLCEIKVTLWD